jgi:hypothetical protein
MPIKDVCQLAVEKRKWNDTRVAMVMMDGWRWGVANTIIAVWPTKRMLSSWTRVETCLDILVRRFGEQDQMRRWFVDHHASQSRNRSPFHILQSSTKKSVSISWAVCKRKKKFARQLKRYTRDTKQIKVQIESIKQSDSMFVYKWKRHQNQDSETKNIQSIYEVHE